MNLYDFKVTDVNGKEVSLKDYQGYVVLIVNTASRCGYAKQLESLESFYQAYKDQKFVVLGFPSNQFKKQEPLDCDILEETYAQQFGVTFPLFDKIEVKGKTMHPLYEWLTGETKGVITSKIKWNFTKFLINRKGNIVERYAPNVEPELFRYDIEDLL
ncbi:MAG: glutathione peroxidase [Acholeplasmataceae bacterium]|jgi:glutathione peroxidase|uniref:glutathione peroxidase n=1 Tax=Liberiplasma polymorphum TaxID=3374570 RepID=UPI0028530E18|nr:glutathione peroxidase [Acholeplasmataceae bacterium]